MCGELKVVHDIYLYNYVPCNYNLQKQGPPPHLHYYDGSMRRFGRQLGFAPHRPLSELLAEIDGVESRTAKQITQQLLQD